jgi:hypothetical protein
MDWMSLLLQGLSKEQVRGVFTVSWRVALIVHIAWLCGFLVPFGIAPPFAKADVVATLQTDVGAIVAELKSDRIDRLDADIFATRRLQCEAIKTGTQEQQRQYADRLNELVNKYKKMTNNYPRIPDCDEI